MRLFIAGTHHSIGKTLCCAWLCRHTGYAYYKPIQMGGIKKDHNIIKGLCPKVKIYPEYFHSTKKSSQLNLVLDSKTIPFPTDEKLILEGTNDIMDPIHHNQYVIDLIEKIKAKVLLVTNTKPGNMHQILLTIEALQKRGIPLIGIIINGPYHQEIDHAIEQFSGVGVVASLPFFDEVTPTKLHQMPLTAELKKYLLAPEKPKEKNLYRQISELDKKFN